ncbi:hypothetical protein DAI22_02g093050 [Oryza sativa Japonica Group]|nr:hypothetical protein DAI22_02g093050 [Oryza sativa Japonica Group]
MSGLTAMRKDPVYDWCLVTISSGWSGKTDATEGYSGSNCDLSTPPTQRGATSQTTGLVKVKAS